MLFITEPQLRKLEAFMQEIPNFPPKGTLIDLDRLEDEILLFKIESVVVNLKPQNLKERKESIMKFRNDHHRRIFLNEAKKQSLKNYWLISALYLLTADETLWESAKSAVGKDEVDFKNIRLKSGSEDAYALYCAAKDLYNGSRQLSIDDIAEVGLVKNKIFSLIFNAIVIKRKGLAAVIKLNVTGGGCDKSDNSE